KRIGQLAGPRVYEGGNHRLSDFHSRLEFPCPMDRSPCPAPTRNSLLDFNSTSRAASVKVAERLHKMGYPEVEPENVYWKELGVTIADPDGWRIVLMNRSFT